jgi:hypothetical protein
MMLLISLGLLVAFGASAATTLGLIDVDLWPELATLVTIMLLGHWLEMLAVGQARGALAALAALAALLPDEAEQMVDGALELVALSSLRVGDTVLVRPGGRVSADGQIVEGDAEFDESVRSITDNDIAARTRRTRYTAGTLAGTGGARGNAVPDYANEDGVEPDRQTETFAEVAFDIDAPRSHGTRFLLRAGKARRERRKGVCVRFRPARPMPPDSSTGPTVR